MKKICLIAILLMGCSHQSLSIEERFGKEFYKPIDTGFIKEMIGVQYSFLEDSVFVVSNKGSYDWKKNVIKVNDCVYDLDRQSGDFCDEEELHKVDRIETAFNEELDKLQITEEELNEYFPGKDEDDE